MPNATTVNAMFARIARRYDAANHVLSGGMDIWWRHRLVAAVRRGRPASVLDLATGSGDVAFALSRGLPAGVAITVMDFCAPMLAEAEKKQHRAGSRYANITFREGDGLALPAADAQFDAVTVSFGLRNMADRHRALTEMHRVLRPGGRLHVLEFSQPQAWFRPLYYLYLRRILPTVAAAVTGDRAAYDYLCGSVGQFPGHQALGTEITAAGFAPVVAGRLTFGIVALHTATK